MLNVGAGREGGLGDGARERAEESLREEALLRVIQASCCLPCASAIWL